MLIGSKTCHPTSHINGITWQTRQSFRVVRRVGEGHCSRHEALPWAYLGAFLVSDCVENYCSQDRHQLNMLLVTCW